MPRYFPITGKYEVKPGFERLGKDHGNGEQDGFIFQCDPKKHNAYLLSKRSVSSTWSFYVDRERFADKAAAFSLKLAELMCNDLEILFQLKGDKMTGMCHGSIEVGTSHVWPIHEMGRALQEDIVVVDKEGIMILVEACHPSGWVPRTLIGQTMDKIHEPIPGIEAIDMEAMTKLMVYGKEPLVRFIWGVRENGSLRPKHPNSQQPAELHLLVERQVIVPMPELELGLFVIKPMLEPLSGLSPEERELFDQAIESMTDEQIAYKEFEFLRKE